MNIDFGLIVGIIGAGAWIPILMEKLQKPKLVGSIENISKMVVHEYNNNRLPSFLKKESVSVYLVKIKLVVLNSDFISKKVEIKCKFKNSDTMIQGTLFYDTDIYYAVEKNGLKLDLKLTDTLIGKVKFVKDELNVLTNTMFLDFDTQLNIEFVEITLTNYKGVKISDKLYFSEEHEYISNDEINWHEKRIV